MDEEAVLFLDSREDEGVLETDRLHTPLSSCSQPVTRLAVSKPTAFRR